MSDDEVLATIVEQDWRRAVWLGSGEKAILFYENGDVRFRHRCDRAHRNAGVIICAPLLQIGNGHTVVQEHPLTIVASIACSDCSTHGFVTDGHWVPA